MAAAVPDAEQRRNQLAPHRKRSESAAADRALRAAALAKAGDRVMARLAEERLDSGYQPTMALTGEKPVVDPAAVAEHRSREVRILADFDTPTAPTTRKSRDRFAAPPPPEPSEPVFGRALHAIGSDQASQAEAVASRPVADPAPISGPAPVAAIAQVAPIVIGPTIPGLIRELAALRDDGIITGSEFEAKKADLLARL